MPQPLLDVPLTFDVPGETVHTPLIHARVGGIDTLLIVDTGATDHVLTMDLVRHATLAADPAEPGTDATGADVPSWAIGELRIGIGDVSLDLNAVVAFEGPPAFARWGIGGFLSPQHLHSDANVVLDLLRPRLVVVDGEPRAAAADAAARYPELVPVWLERERGDATILVRLALDPYPPVVTLLDTGGKSTEFAPGAVPGLVVGDVAVAGRGLSGQQISGAVAHDAKLRVGDRTVAVDRLFVRTGFADGVQGLVGMDVLRGSVLMVAADQRRPVLWLLPAGERAR